MKQFFAILSDCLGEDFSIEFEAADYDAAYEYVKEQYPESGIVRLTMKGGLPKRRNRRRYYR